MALTERGCYIKTENGTLADKHCRNPVVFQ